MKLPVFILMTVMLCIAVNFSIDMYNNANLEIGTGITDDTFEEKFGLGYADAQTNVLGRVQSFSQETNIYENGTGGAEYISGNIDEDAKAGGMIGAILNVGATLGHFLKMIIWGTLGPWLISIRLLPLMTSINFVLALMLQLFLIIWGFVYGMMIVLFFMRPFFGGD